MVGLDEGAELFRAGQDGDQYCIVMRGEVGLHHATGVWSALLGDAFGEIAVLDRVPRTASAVMGRSGAVLMVSGDRVRDTLGR